MRRVAPALLLMCAVLSGAACRSDDPVVDTDGPVTTAPVRVIGVEVVAGKVVGGEQDVRLAVGEAARLNVRSDLPDEVLVTVLDQRLQVWQGGVATLDLVTERAGNYEVRLVQQNLLLVTIRVTDAGD